MRIARVRRALWVIGGLASAGAVAVVIAAALSPLDASSDSSETPRPQAPNLGAKSLQATLPLSAFASAWRVQLRRPLIDPPPDAASNAIVDISSKPAPVNIRLIGTIIDAHHPRGVFMTGLATVELKGVGDRVGGGTVLSIERDSATLAYNGGTITLPRERKPFDPSGQSYEAATSDARSAPE